jgi:hypothetical protein
MEMAAEPGWLHCPVETPGGPSLPRPTKDPSCRPRESPSGLPAFPCCTGLYDGTNMKISRACAAWDSGSACGALFLLSSKLSLYCSSAL